MKERKTTMSIDGNQFMINGKYTYPGRHYNGSKIEGLLLFSRMVNGIIDDRNPETRGCWGYPDGPWDPERNTSEFIKAMPTWRKYGLLSFSLFIQGCSPQGYSWSHPWLTSGFNEDGTLRPEYLSRLERILDKADELGMVVDLGLFYFGQSRRIKNEEAVKTAVRETINWIIEKGYKNVIVEIANEIDIPLYTHDIIEPPRCHELINLVKKISSNKIKTELGRLIVGTSFGGGTIPPDNVMEVSDVILVHGNRQDPDSIRKMIRTIREKASYKGQPIMFNEDDHYDFEKEDNNMMAAITNYASWGFFDFRYPGDGFEDGFQSIPVDWEVNSIRKKQFFSLVAKLSAANNF